MHRADDLLDGVRRAALDDREQEVLHLRVVLEDAEDAVPRHRDRVDVGVGGHGRRARLRGHHGDLADHGAGTELREMDLARRRLGAHAHLPVEDEEHDVARLVLPEDDVARGVGLHVRALEHPLAPLEIEALEEVASMDEVRHVAEELGVFGRREGAARRRMIEGLFTPRAYRRAIFFRKSGADSPAERPPTSTHATSARLRASRSARRDASSCRARFRPFSSRVSSTERR